ncbi:MAG: TonB-dependent receptor [Pigmentiphaga sp.]|nr:TonB-dependent receptor [Pigmentiphaga sp.]MDX3904072.1 TonB-dependent receptor [Pigmentiphaga sp.]
MAPVAAPLLLACAATPAQAQETAPTSEVVQSLAPIEVNASADASAEGLSPAFAGGQVTRGGRAGILGTRDNMDTPFSITSYTNELIQDKQARSVGDVLQNDPGVRVARGFGNFQESYFIRGFILSSDDVAYNGLYNLLPRQYIATELFERVEVLRGASAFLTGATPGNTGIGGAINLLPKRAPNEPLTRITLGASGAVQGNVAVDVGRRFGPDGSTGIRFNAAYRDGDTAVDDEHAQISVAALGLDWRSSTVRLSGDVGWQDNRLKRTRPSVTLNTASVPSVPDASRNFAQPWTYSNERDLFGTLRGEADLSDAVTAWGAFGIRRSDEANSLAGMTVTDGNTGAGNYYRFDNTREDSVNTGEIGLRGKLRTGPVGHEWVASASYYGLKKKNAYAMDYLHALPTNLYSPIFADQPAFSADVLRGNALEAPALNGRTRLLSVALGDTLSLLDDRLQFTLGARYQQLRIQNYAYNTGEADAAYDKSRTSPMAGVVFKLNRQFSLYGNYIEALSQGDAAPRADADGIPVLNAGQMLSPYVSKQKEAGIKYDGGALGAGLAVFSTDKPGGRITQTEAGPVFTANGKDRHRGVELTVYGQPLRGLRVLGGATWLDAKQRITEGGTNDGKRVIGVPAFQANLGAEWDIPGVPGLALDGRVVYTGARYADPANALKVGGWTRVDVGLRYLTEIHGKLVTLRARVDNLTDRAYWASVGGYPGSGYLVVGAPRTFSLSATMEF